MRARAISDVAGAIGSAICAVHCLAGPIVLLTGTVLPSALLPDESFHRAMLWLVLPTGAVAFSLGCRRHKDPYTFLLGAAGLLGYWLATTTLHRSLGETGEKIFMLLAAAALIGGHIRNFRLCRADDCRHECDVDC